MPLEQIKSKLPKKAQLLKMNRTERIRSELKTAAEIGVHHQGHFALGANFRNTKITSRKTNLVGLKKPTAQELERNDNDVQPGSLFIGASSPIVELPQFAPDLLEKQILAQVERMGERTFANVAAQVLPQLNALGILGKQSSRLKAVQTALAKRAYGEKAMAAMKRKKNGGIEG